MRNPTPAPIVVPVTGTPTCRGIYLGTHDLSEWSCDADMGKDADMVIKARADRATRDGAVLCLRPTAEGKGACVGMTPTAFAVASLAEDFAARALVVDPYDRDGNDIREAPPVESEPCCELCGLASCEGADGSMCESEAAQVDVWEASEAV